MLFRAMSLDGGLIFADGAHARAYLYRYDREALFVTVEPEQARRSVPQNRRLWAGYNRAVKSFAALTRHDTGELHDAMKRRSEVLTDVPLYTPDGLLIGPCRSTKRLNVERFGDYMEEVSAFFASAGCDLYPEEA